jgi:hypothetical protein
MVAMVRMHSHSTAYPIVMPMSARFITSCKMSYCASLA